MIVEKSFVRRAGQVIKLKNMQMNDVLKRWKDAEESDECWSMFLA